MASRDHTVLSSMLERLSQQDQAEYIRLQLQNDLLIRAMGGEPIRTPLPPAPKILDSATSDGRWMLEISTRIPNAKLYGTDLEPAHFGQIKDLPSNISFEKQSIFDPWPSSYLSSFDLVHQRYCLPMLKPAAAVEPVQGLFSCVKPGGWIQLVEADLSNWRIEGKEHEAFKRMKEFIVKAFDNANMNAASGPYAKGWLEQVGAINVHEEVIAYEVGVSEKDPYWAAKGEASILSMLDMYRDIASKVPNYFFTPEDFKSLRPAVEQELHTVGNHWAVHVVWGQKPF